MAIKPLLAGFDPAPPQDVLQAAERLRHYGTFGLLTGTPEAFRELLPDSVELVAPAPGETVEL